MDRKPSRRQLSLALGLALAFLPAGAAFAISTLEDLFSAAPRILRTPSGMPPNNAIHRGFGLIGTPGGARGVPDRGPRPGEDPLEVPASSAPWTVAISETENLQEDFLCAGVLVAPDWVLTTAHCIFLVSRRWPNDARPLVFLGSRALNEPGERVAVEEVVIHPQYSPQTLRNDLALLRIGGGERRAPIPIDGPPVAEQVGDVGTIIGFGAGTSAPNTPRMGGLRLVQTAIVDDAVCFSPTNYAALRSTGVYCARPLVNYDDLCFRFSGSPMVIYDARGTLYLIGIVSWNTACPGHASGLSVFQDVHVQAPWIKSVIGGGGS